VHQLHTHRSRQCVVIEFCSIAPEWPLLITERHRSAGEWLHRHSWSTNRPCGRPGWRFQSAPGNLFRERSTCSFKAWWAGIEAGSLATWQKTTVVLTYMLLILNCSHGHSNVMESECWEYDGQSWRWWHSTLKRQFNQDTKFKVKAEDCAK